ncbi:phytanoyl-CoA dioxygenase family protein [Paenibacillus koleovorans]|uniref:phytanoyl-CoA dioxygenase family protein n=1 Tax=Paenibacillus koleovorans TaxID=121608 RepID=UPI000FD7E928|nr:phytanoyl-CoA dioxygenase family protein [Paenibacillus koleovorans]
MALLSQDQVDFYKREGYLIGLPKVFDEEQMKSLNEGLQSLVGQLDADEKLLDIREWHLSSRWLYDLCTTPLILDYVESLLGPNFYLWGSQFFAKEPRSKSRVGWHQDSYYWPLSPHHSVTVWLAFTDVDVANGAMYVIPGSHRAGLIKHITTEEEFLNLELELGSFREQDKVALEMKAGQLSLHDDAMVHGSPANNSDRWRIGLTIRYSATDVKCDLSKAPLFKTMLVRGEDTFNHNPVAPIPAEPYARLPKDQYLHMERVIK